MVSQYILARNEGIYNLNRFDSGQTKVMYEISLNSVKLFIPPLNFLVASLTTIGFVATTKRVL